jgi:hypothetical protein
MFASEREVHVFAELHPARMDAPVQERRSEPGVTAARGGTKPLLPKAKVTYARFYI